MKLELEDIVPHRDYKLKYIFKCNCGKPASIFLHRTEEDIKNHKNNIYQRCYDGHITRPRKYCTYCKITYDVEQELCIQCEPRVIENARNFIIQEQIEKEMRKNKSVAGTPISIDSHG